MAIFEVVLSSYRTKGSSSAHLPFFSSNLFFKLLTMILFLDSAWPLTWGWTWIYIIILISQLTQMSLVLLLTNWNPLLHMISVGILNLVSIIHWINETTSFSLTWTKSSASIHFEKYFVITNMNTFSPGAFVGLPTIYIPHFMKGQGEIIGFNGSAGLWRMLLCLWQESNL